MRLFTGLALPPPVLQTMEALLAALKPLAPLKWSPAENLHITTRFIGEWPDARLPELTRALAAIPRPGAIPIHLQGFGFMPNPHRPRAFFAAVKAPPSLHQLAAATDQALEPLGCVREDREYRPHLTLARIATDHIGPLRERIADMKNPDFGSFLATEFHLYRSQTGGRASVYTTLASFPLTGPLTGQAA